MLLPGACFGLDPDYVDRLSRGAIIYVDYGHYMMPEKRISRSGRIFGIKERKMFMKILKGLGWLLLTVSIFIGFTFIALKIIEVVNAPFDDEQVDLWIGHLGIVIASVFLASVSYRKGWCKDLTYRKVSFGPHALFISLASVAGITVLIGSVIGISLNGILPLTPEPPEVSGIAECIASILIAPVAEEFLFRYGVYGLLRNIFNSKVAMVISALSFTIVHGFQLQGFIECIFVALVLAYVFEKTGNIWYSISVHAALNAFAEISNTLVAKGIPFYSEINGYEVHHPGVVAAAVVTVVVCVVVLRKWKMDC